MIWPWIDSGLSKWQTGINHLSHVIWNSFFIHVLQKQNLLTEEQKVNDPNPLYELAQDAALHN